MNPTITQDLALFSDFIETEQEMGIVIGGHQTIDTIAAGLSLFLSLSQAGKKVQIISVNEPLVEFSNLVGVDRITKNFSGNTTKLVVSLPYVKGEVEKVLFTEAQNTINFHLTAASGRVITPFEKADIKLNFEGGSPTNIITLGVGNLDELTGIVETQNARIVNIDNYQGNNRFGEIVLVSESLSSLSEIIGKIIKELKLPFDVDIAQNILDGILFGTRNFTKQNTSPLAFEAASSAMYQGAQRKEDRREQGFTSTGRQSQQPDRFDRSGRDQQRQNRPFDSAQGKQVRVSETDFPALHMQGQRVSQNQNQGQINDNRRINPARNDQISNRQQTASPLSQNQNINELRNKIMEEDNRQPSRFAPAEDIKDVQLVEPQTSLPAEDIQVPEEQPYIPPNIEDVPDDWLMPKVFKSSKNNN